MRLSRALAEQIGPIVADACLELALTLRPIVSPRPATLHDPEAEAVLLASRIEGLEPTEPLDASDYYCSIHRAVAMVLDRCRAKGREPTRCVLLEGLADVGARGRLIEESVDRILAATPVCVRPDAIAHGIRTDAWRRRLSHQADRLRVIAGEQTATCGEVEAEIDALVDLATAMPKRCGA